MDDVTPPNMIAEDYSLARLEKIAAELSDRQTEALRVYRPSKIQDKYHASKAKECVFVAGNQVGKSIAGYMEDGRAVCACDPYEKYPKEGGIGAIVVYKESQIKLNVYRYLLKPGAIDIIQDEHTGLWRPYYPWMPQDQARKRDRRPAPPIIPRRMIKRIHWKSKTGNVFTRLDLETGWELHVFSSTAKPDAGFQADFVHIDEDIANEEWYVEMIARLSIRQGYLRWTALPLFDNDVLPRIVERGDDEREKFERGDGEEPTTHVVRATIYDNPYLTEETRNENIKRWRDAGEDVLRQRAYGELITDTVRMYPTFSDSIHAIQRYKDSHKELFAKYLENYEIPNEWCIRLFVDPGFSRAGGLLIATLPGDYPVHVAVRELYPEQCTPSKFVEQLHKTLSGRWIQAHYMDAHGGRLTSLSNGIRPQEMYEQEMAKWDILSVETKHRFRPGCDVTEYREQRLRELLSVRPGIGLPTFLYDEQHCPNLFKEMTRLRKLRISGVVTDKRNPRMAAHLVDCAEYAAAEPLTYVAPPARRVVESPGHRRARLFKERKAKRERSRFNASGGPAVGGFVM